jgi:hypothetical protein
MMRIKSTIGAVCVLAGIASCPTSAQSKNAAEQHSIDVLKAIPVARIEPDMPKQPLGEWLVANAKGTEVEYTPESCADFGDANPKPGKDDRCVMVTLLRGSVVLKFAVSGAEDGNLGPVQCRYLGGWEGPPPGSAMKRPTKAIRKLHDLRTMLGWQ